MVDSTERISIDCAPLGAHRIYGASVVEAIDLPTRGAVALETDAPLEAAELLGVSATINGRGRSFPLVIVEVDRSDLDAGANRYQLVLEHPIALLRFRRDHRTFLEKSVKAIVEALLAPLSLTPTWKASRGTTPRVVCVQYGETDFDFVMRLLEEEGIFWFAPDDPSTPKITIADASSAFEPIEGDPEIPITGEGVGTGIHQLTFEHVITSGAVALADYDFEKPGVDLTARASLDDDPAGELFEYPGRYGTPADGTALAKVRAEEIASTKVRISGTSSRPELRAGSTFEVSSIHEGNAGIGKVLVRSVEHGFAEAYQNSFVGSPFELPYRPRRKTPRPQVGGTLVATVTGPAGQEIHTDKLGRMKVKYAFDRLGKSDDTSSQWMRQAQPVVGGSMMLARVGWEMALRHLDGNPDRPVGVARMYDGEHVPPEKLPGTQTKTSFETLTSPRGEKLNAITIDDKGGAMLFEVNAAKDLDATVLHDETESIGANDTLAVGKDSTTLIGDAQATTIEKDDTSTAAKDAGIAVAGDRTKTVTKNETTAIEGAVSVRVDGNDEETVGKDLKTSADEAMLETTKGKYDLTVGGAVTAKTKKDYTIYVAGKSTETIGAAKTTASSDGSLVETVGGDASSTIGGAWVETVEGNRSSSSQGAMKRTIGAVASLTATGKLQIKAKTMGSFPTTAATWWSAAPT